MRHPIAEIHFEQVVFGDPDDLLTFVAYWYHVPRVGDMVSLSETGGVWGKVESATWLDGHVIIRLKSRRNDA